MRNALLFVVLFCILLLKAIEPATAAIDHGQSVYAQQILTTEDPPQLLPPRGAGFTSEAVSDREVRPAASPQSSAVEVIPTPTAFHAGGALLVLIILSRFFRRLRRV